MIWGLLGQQEPGSWIDLALGPLGLTVGLIVAVLALVRRKLITRGTYDERVSEFEKRELALIERCSRDMAKLEREKDEWKTLALRLANVAEVVAAPTQEPTR